MARQRDVKGGRQSDKRAGALGRWVLGRRHWPQPRLRRLTGSRTCLSTPSSMPSARLIRVVCVLSARVMLAAFRNLLWPAVIRWLATAISAAPVAVAAARRPAWPAGRGRRLSRAGVSFSPAADR